MRNKKSFAPRQNLTNKPLAFDETIAGTLMSILPVSLYRIKDVRFSLNSVHDEETFVNLKKEQKIFWHEIYPKKFQLEQYTGYSLFAGKNVYYYLLIKEKGKFYV